MKTIPPLLLADSTAKEARSFAELVAMHEHSIASGWGVDHAVVASDCKFRFNSFDVGEARISAYSFSPAQYKGSRSQAPVLNVSFEGDFSYRQGAKTIEEKAGSVASLIPADEAYDGFGVEVGVGVSLSPDPERLARTLRTMSGHHGGSDDADARLEVARALPLQQQGFDIFKSFKHLIGLINVVENQPAMMRLLAVDDALYRHAAMMLRPDLLLHDYSFGQPHRSSIDKACDYMQANLDQAVFLTELESISGLSARSLQYGFHKRFGCTPLQWLSQARLDLARTKLLNPDAETTVTRVALEAGFTNPGNFARKYFERFSELPSQTLSSKSSL